MTHGCIIVQRADEKNRRILLHTYHSGYLIPDIVTAAPAFICKHRWSFILEDKKKFKYKNVADMRDQLDRLGFDSGMYYQPSVAALLVAQRPYVLEVVPDEFKTDMAEWSGADHPWVLTMNEDKQKWSLKDEDGKDGLIIKPTDAMYQWLWEEYKRRSKKNQNPPTPQ